MVVEQFLEPFGEARRIQQIAGPQATPCDFVFISRADAAPGGADGFAATGFFPRQDPKRHAPAKSGRRLR